MNEYDKDSVISTRDLALGYDHHAIVTNITLDIKKGEFIGILGPNGSGKSTFFRALLGLVKPMSGQIRVLNAPPLHGNTNIGYMPQMRRYISIANLTSRALLAAVCNGLNLGLPVLTRTKKIEIQKTLEIVQATSYADRPLRQLSGGERQRIYLAQALLGKPAILLLDEPLSNLDPRYQDVFVALLNDIKNNLNITILFTAHDPNPLLHTMNRVLYFANGKAVIGQTDQVITSETLTAMYGTRIEVVKFKDRLFVMSEAQQNILGEVRHHHD
jgi:zinc/manganese transport system ATP-binding protein